MKKILQLLVLIAVAATVLTACSGQKGTVANSNVARGKFTGTWTVTRITYEGLVESAVQNVFDQAPPAAFRNSTWQLTNSGNGMYTLANGTSQSIYWGINNTDASGQIFQFKKIYQGDKPKNVTEGYQLYVAGNDGATMTLKSPVALGGSNAYIVYHFAKTK